MFSHLRCRFLKKFGFRLFSVKTTLVFLPLRIELILITILFARIQCNCKPWYISSKKYWKCQALPLTRFFCRLRAHFDKETFCKRWYISSKKIRRCHVQLSRHFLSIYFWHNTSSFLITKLFANVGTYPRKKIRKYLSQLSRPHHQAQNK